MRRILQFWDPNRRKKLVKSAVEPFLDDKNHDLFSVKTYFDGTPIEEGILPDEDDIDYDKAKSDFQTDLIKLSIEALEKYPPYPQLINGSTPPGLF